MPRQRQKQNVWASMTVCAQFYGVDKSFIQECFNDGAPGLHGSRVWQSEFEPFWAGWYAEKKSKIEAAGAKSKEEWQLLILSEKHRKDKRLNDIEEAKLVPIDWAHSEIRAQAESAQSVFNSIPSRMAMDLAGLKPFEIEQRLKIAISEGISKMGEKPLP